MIREFEQRIWENSLRMRIIGLETEHLRFPLPRAVSITSSQDPRAAKEIDVVLVHLKTDGSKTGLGFTYSLGFNGEVLKSLIDTIIAPIVLGEDPELIERLFLRTSLELESLGSGGLVHRAYAAVDFALWDLKGRMAGLPVFKLLGGYRTKLKALASDTATPALGTKAAIKETKAALDAGAAGVIVEIGTADPDIDAERLRSMRGAVPEGAWFEVSANTRYDFSTALWMAKLCEDEFAIDGFSDPLRTNDPSIYRKLSDRLEVAISAGSLIDRVDDAIRLLENSDLSAIRIDPVRLGGLTPSKKIAAFAEQKQTAICPVRLPEVGSHLAAGFQLGRVCETVDWFDNLFIGGPRYEGGQFVVSENPGLGIELNESFVKNHRID